MWGDDALFFSIDQVTARHSLYIRLGNIYIASVVLGHRAKNLELSKQTL